MIDNIATLFLCLAATFIGFGAGVEFAKWYYGVPK